MKEAGGRASGKSGGHSFGGGVDAAARSMIADARLALTNPEPTDAETVHTLRKAFKRWRALLRLLAKPIGAQADQMRAEARNLMHALAGARDAQSALDALADLQKSAGTDAALSARSMNTIRQRLTVLRDAAEQASVTDETKARILRYLDEAEPAVGHWSLLAIKFDTVADGLTTSYRRVRAKVPDDWRNADDEQIHDLRRRVVDYRHQMDLIAPLWPRLAVVWTEEAQRLRNRLGACQDMAVLSKLTAPHQPLSPWRSRLAPMIEARRAAHLKTAERLAGRLFAEKPKAFRHRIVALWTAHLAKKR